MKILVIGSGGREHAIIRALKRSEKSPVLYCAPGNGGITADATCVDIAATDIKGVVDFAKQNQINMVFVAPDDPLAMGMVDALNAAGIRAFGPDAAAARIEASKVFSKNLMKKYNIPTAAYEVFDNADDAISYIKSGKFPVVVKADGLALGKGVIICEDLASAISAVNEIMVDKMFGSSGNHIVIEEFISGPEVSVLAFADGITVKPMVSSMDHKRIFDGNKGPNTGGMGTISPNPFYDDAMAKRCMNEIFLPTMGAMRSEGCPFKGCLYFGLMLTKDGPKVIEYNARFGDPETQVVLPRMKTDFIDVIDAVIDGTLSSLDIEWEESAVACVVLASGGYPGSYPKGKVINGLNKSGQLDGNSDIEIFHAGTALKDGEYVTSGGRVLGVTAKGENLEKALDKAYTAVRKISFDGAQYRKDIGTVAW